MPATISTSAGNVFEDFCSTKPNKLYNSAKTAQDMNKLTHGMCKPG